MRTAMEIETPVAYVEINYDIDETPLNDVNLNCRPRPKLNLLKLCKDIPLCPGPCPDMSDPNENDCAILFAAFVAERADEPYGICWDSTQSVQMDLCTCASVRANTYCSSRPEDQWIKPLFEQWVTDHWHEMPGDCCSSIGSRNFDSLVKEEVGC